MLMIRLTRVGKTNSPHYRVVVADKKRAVKGKFIEIIGHYSPTSTPRDLVIKKDRATFWMGQGAQTSDTVRNLMVDLGILEEKVNKKFSKEFTKKQIKEGVDKKPVVAEVKEEAEAVVTEAPAEETEVAVEVETPVVEEKAPEAEPEKTEVETTEKE